MAHADERSAESTAPSRRTPGVPGPSGFCVPGRTNPALPESREQNRLLSVPRSRGYSDGWTSVSVLSPGVAVGVGSSGSAPPSEGNAEGS